MTDKQKLTDERKNKLMEEYTVWEEKFNKQGKPIAKRINIPHLAELIFHELGYYFFTTYDNQEIYRYNGSFYDSEGIPIINYWVEEFLQEETKEHLKKETVGYIRDKNYKDRAIFNSNPYLINLQNGIYDLKTNKFSEHNPDNYFLSEIPVEYNKKAKIKKIKTFLKQVLKQDDIKRLQEIYGYCLYQNYHIQKAFMFLGEGANGKSTVLNLLKKLLGNHNVSSVSLQELCDNRFAPGNLYGKLANIYPDLPDKTLTKTGMFKILTGGDTISAEQKFKDYFNFVNHAKLIFSANKLPETRDDTNAYFRRWEFINFPYTFYGEKCDPKILNKISTENEISGLFNWSLTGLRRLLRNGAFTNSSSVDEMREKYQRLSSPVASFVLDCIEISQGFYIFKDDLYACFVDYCVKNGLPVCAKNTFSSKLHEHVRVTEYRPPKHSDREKRDRAWLGIDFTEYVQSVQNVHVFSYPYRTDAGIADIKIENNMDKQDRLDTKEGNSDV